MAVGASGDDDGGTNRGAFRILLLTDTGTIKTEQKVSSLAGGFWGTLHDDDRFGASIANVGDLDGNGVDDLAVGAPWDDDGGTDRGAVWILFLQADGTVAHEQKISDLEGNFLGALNDGGQFGYSLTCLGDLDGDGTDDLAVGLIRDSYGGTSERGSVWILFLNPDGTVKGQQKIGTGYGGFVGTLDTQDHFGRALTSLGDLDGDNITDLAVSAVRDDDGGTDRGAVYVLFLHQDGSVKAQQKISDTQGGFTDTLHDVNFFGSALTPVGDLNNDGVTDLAVGAIGDNDGGYMRGALWLLYLKDDGTVSWSEKISNTSGGFTAELEDEDWFGWSLAAWTHPEDTYKARLAVGANFDDDGGYRRGALYVLLLGQVTYEPRTFHVDAVNGSNSNDGLTNISAFLTIQHAINAARNDDTILVWPGTYSESLDFLGKAITLTNAADPPHLHAPAGTAVSFTSGETADAVLSHFVISNSDTAILINDASPTLTHLSIVANESGVVCSGDNAQPAISNCLIWNWNYGADLVGCSATYCDIATPSTGLGNFSKPPLAADYLVDDYHLKSRRGRFVPTPPDQRGWAAPSLHSELLDGSYLGGSPCLTPDKRTIYFGRYGDDHAYGLIIEARRNGPTGPFTSERLLTELDQGNHMSPHWVSPDGNRLYFHESTAENVTMGYAQRDPQTGLWSRVRHLTEIHVEGYPDVYPSLTADELTIYWQSNRPGSANYDIWTASRNSTEDPFGTPQLATELNTEVAEASPCVLPDGLTMYFVRVANATQSTEHFIKATRASTNQPFANFAVVAFPGSTGVDEDMPFVTADEKDLYFNYVPNTGIMHCQLSEGQWVLDDLDSPCLDTADPTIAPAAERMPNGGRLNIGAYGGTPYASMSEWPLTGDLNHDGVVNLLDLALTGDAWLTALPWAQ